MNTTTENIRIDPEFQSLIPPLSADELAQLESNLIADGCRDPIVLWDGVIVDGHNRFRICSKQGIEFETVAHGFDDRSEAKCWIIRNQFGRRNLTGFVRSELALVLEDELAAKAKERQGARTDLKSNICQNSDKCSAFDTKRELATVAGVSHDTIARVKKIKERADDEIQNRLRAGEVSINQVYTQIKRAEKEQAREQRREENRAKVATVDEPTKLEDLGSGFATIVIDPPWDWGDEGDVNQMGRAKPDYATMGIDDLLGLPVDRLADEDAHLYLWITNRSLPKGFQLLDRWGFRYITAITWVKPSFGMGNYFRGQTEHVLFGVKGSQPLLRKNASTLFHAPRGPGGHSSKPDEFLAFVESCSPGPYLELFSRHARPGWQQWGEGS